MSPQLSFSLNGREIQIPTRLYNLIQAQEGMGVALADGEQLETDTSEWQDLTEGEALKIFTASLREKNIHNAILALATYSVKTADSFNAQGRPNDGLALLAEAIAVEQEVLPHCDAGIARRLTKMIVAQTEDALDLCRSLASLDAALSVGSETGALLKMLKTGWEPELQDGISAIENALKILLTVPLAMESARTEKLRDLANQLSGAKKLLASLETGAHHKRLLSNLVEAWSQIAQQEILLIAAARYSSEGFDYESLSKQAQLLIGQTERRLRAAIVKYYQAQFGAGWLDHIKARHARMYEIWMSNKERDKAAFRIYQNYVPDPLEYARFEDLIELITVQWHLFKDIFDFGFSGRNRSLFYDKMTQIMKVRNPLAHNRSIPENELWRARVYCMDILLALDKSESVSRD